MVIYKISAVVTEVRGAYHTSWDSPHPRATGSYSVTCHPTQVNMPCLNPNQAGLIYLPPEGLKAELTWVVGTDTSRTVHLLANSHPSE